MTIAHEIVRKTSVGSEEAVQPSSLQGFDLQRFQDVVDELDAMEQQGLITISLRHRESQTGQQYVDLVRFTRNK